VPPKNCIPELERLAELGFVGVNLNPDPAGGYWTDPPLTDKWWTPLYEKLCELDPRLGRRPSEKLLPKRYASAFKGTHLHEMLTALGVDTLIVTGVSTSHCVYATCRDATDSVRVIVPREAVGERCELMHEVNLLDIELDLGDVVPADEVVAYLKGLSCVPRGLDATMGPAAGRLPPDSPPSKKE
jgi:nicotinamidase-related amidase